MNSERGPRSNNVLGNLLEEAEAARGYITYDQILEAFPEIEDDLMFLEDVIEEIQIAGFTIYESEEEVLLATSEGNLSNGDNLMQTSSHDAPLFDLSNVLIDDSVGLYFREMGQQKLLTQEEELQITKDIEDGLLAKEIIKQINLPADDIDEYIQIKENGEAARAHLIRANTRLVVSIAKRYRGRGLQFLDLIQEGNIGLMKAVEKYDYRRGNRFSTYATWWIRQSVTRALANDSRTIRIPAHMGGRINRLYQVSQELEQELGRQPSAEEIAEHMDLPVDRVRWLLRTSRQPVQLEQPVGNEDAELGYFIEDPEQPDPSENVAKRMLTEEIGLLLDQLTPRETRILRLRYGLQDGESRTLKEVGEMFGLSRERIRQIEKEALRKLKSPRFAGHLRHFLD